MTRPVSRLSVGVDGYARGWVAVALDRAGVFARAWPASTLDALLAPLAPDVPVGVDIPIGGVPVGWRDADRQAQAQLGPRRSTLFTVPPRPLWALATYADANAKLRRLNGSGLSRQAWNLTAKMLEADALRDGRELFEVHPELVFAEMAGAPLPPKSTWAGLMRRRFLLAEVGVDVPDDLGPAGAVPADDILDAAAVAWCAYRYGRGGANHVPDPPSQYDERGQPIVIWY